MLLRKIFKNEKDSEQNNNINFEKIPEHVAIIMDGNGRWAKKRLLPRKAGHREGANNLKKVIRHLKEFGVKYVTVYAFSTENWNRPKSEVDALMNLLYRYLRNAEKELGEDKVRITTIGDISKLPQKVQDEIDRVKELTKNYDGIDLIIALNYGSRMEITNALNSILEDIKSGKIVKDKITEEDISKYLYTKDIPDPDLLIRTSGELRISNYMLWQTAYSELWFTDVLWPDFGKNDMIEALSEYAKRKRRYGGI